MKWSDKLSYDGKRVNRGTLSILTAANIILQNSSRYGKEKSNISLTQGGYNKGGVAASAGTHDGGGAIDITAYNYKNRVKVLRILGVAAWYRPTRKNVWSQHIHGIVCGDGTASRGAQAQVNEYYHGGDGLVGSAKDPDWRPRSLPILFVAPWDKRGEVGIYTANQDTRLMDEPNSSSTLRGVLKLGSTVNIVAVVNVSGVLWAISSNGDCMLKSSITLGSIAVKPTPTLEPFNFVWRVTKDSKWGYDHPGGDKKYERNTNYKLYTTHKAVVDGIQWYVTEYGTWYDENNLIAWVDEDTPGNPNTEDPDTETPNTPNKPVEESIRVFGVNAAAYYQGSNWDKRVPLLGKMRDQSRSSISIVCESHTYAKGAQLNRAFGWGGVRAGTGKNASFVLHGRDARISTAIHWDPSKYRWLEEGQFDTLKGSSHNGATFVLLERIDSRALYLCLGTHLQYLPKGPNNKKTKWDTERKNQLTGALKEAKKLASNFEKKYGRRVGIIVGEDFNAHRRDAYDGPGVAIKNQGFKDAEVVKDYGDSIAMYDRFAVRDLYVIEFRAIKSNGGTDHSHGLSMSVRHV